MTATWVELDDGVFVRHYDELSINVGAVVGGDGVLVVDTRTSEIAGGILRAELARLSVLPVRWVVNTHWHWDHTFGNGSFPNAEVWGHPDARDDLIRHGEEARQEAVEWLGEARRAELEAVVIRPPQHMVYPEALIDLGGRAVTLRYVGRGHTSGDVVVIPDGTSVLFAGDLVEEGGPPMFGDAFPSEWPETLSRLLDLVRGPVVPGHGAIVDRVFVERQQADIAVVASLAARAGRGGGGAADLTASPYPEATTRLAVERHLAVT